MLENIVEVWAGTGQVALVEASQSSDVDGEHIIGRAVAEAFFLNKASRNNRFYPEEAWRNALGDETLRSRLEKRLVFGTVGHDQPLDDVAVRDGKISHIVNKIFIDESGRGMAEFLILNTPSGRTLNTVLRAGSAISVSTRARGEYLPRKNESGQNVIDPKKFVLDSIDFVIDPGFLEAKPNLVEEIEREVKKASLSEEQVTEVFGKADTPEQDTVSEDSPSIEQIDGTCQIVGGIMDGPYILANTGTALNLDTHMQDKNSTVAQDEAVVEYLKAELTDLKESRNTALELVETLKSKLDTAESTVEQLQHNAVAANDALTAYRSIGEAEEIAEALRVAEETLTAYAELGSPDEIQEAMAELESTLGEYKALGAVEDLQEALARSHDVFEELGKPSEIREALALLDAFAQLGTPDDIREALETFNNLIEEMGTPEEIDAALKRFESLVEELGTPDDICEALNRSEQFFESLRQEKLRAEALELSTKTNLKVGAVVEMLNSGKTAEDILEMFEVVEADDSDEEDEGEDGEQTVDEKSSKSSKDEEEEDDEDDDDDDDDEDEDDDDDEDDDEDDDADEGKKKSESLDESLSEHLSRRLNRASATSLMEGNRYTGLIESVECPVASKPASSRAARLMR